MEITITIETKLPIVEKITIMITITTKNNNQKNNKKETQYTITI
jgi:hypothetical protein